MSADDDRWRRDTIDVDDPATATTAASPQIERIARRGGPQTGPFDPPARARFEERGELGRGGMGRVFEARDTSLARPVAIKQSLTDDEIGLARFERETLITARLQHPGIVPVLDAGRDSDGRPYYIMRKIEGRRLADLISEAKTVPARIALVPRILGAIDAIAYAHSQGVIHRDLKSWNVLLGEFGETLVIDWGLARDLDDTSVEPISDAPGNDDDPSSLTRAGVAYGTPGFMPPEQARGERIDRRADVYALGAMLLHALQGTYPYADMSAGEAIVMAALDAPPDLSNIPEQTPPELLAIVTKAMAPAADERYPDAAALADDVRRFTAGQLVAAHQYTLPQLVARWLRRHRLAVTIGALAVVVLAVVGVLAIRGVIAERDRADIAASSEAARADQLLVQRADVVALDDPTKAIAMLKQLRPDSAEWEHAAATYDSAIARGVARGRLAHPGARSPWIGASAAGDIATVAEDGKVMLHDPALIAPSRVLATLDAPTVATWFGRSLIVVARSGLIARVELDGSVKPLQGIARWVVATDTQLFAVGAQGVVHELDPDGGPVGAELGAITTLEPIGDALIFATPGAVIYLARNRPPLQLLDIPRDEVVSIEVSPDRRHFAAGTSTLAVEWELAAAGPRETNRWSVDAAGLSYAGRFLVAESVTHLYTTLGPNHTTYPRKSLAGIRRVAVAKGDCSYLATWAATLYMTCATFTIRFGSRTEAIAGLAIGNDHLVGVTHDGYVLSWDLASLQPRQIAPEDGGVQGATLIGGKLFSAIGDMLQAFDLDTRRRVSFGEMQVVCHTARHVVITPRIPRPNPVLTSVDLATLAERRLISDRFPSVICGRDDRIALIDESSVEIRDLATGAAQTLAIDHPASWAALDGRWLAIATVNTGEVERIDLDTGARVRVAFPDGVKFVIVDDTGRIVTISGQRAMVGTGDGAPLVELARDVQGINATAAGVLAVTRNHSVAVLDRDNRIRSFQAGTSFSPSAARNRPLATLPDLDDTPIVIDLRDGTARHYPIPVIEASLDTDGSVAYGFTGGIGLVWAIAKPPAPSELRAALARATNATLPPNSTRVEFGD